MNTPACPRSVANTLLSISALLLPAAPLPGVGKESQNPKTAHFPACMRPEFPATQTQAPEKNTPPAESPLIRGARALWEQNKLPSVETLQGWIQSPSGGVVHLATVANTLLPAREIAKRAAAAYIRVGWVYQCSKCSNWHTSLAGGYAIAPDAVATAAHVLDKPQRMKEATGYPVAVRGGDEVLIICGIVAVDPATDAAILRVEAHNLQALALSTDAQVGDSVFCLSEPGGHGPPYFSAGIVNRFLTTDAHTDQKQLQPNAPKVPRINVSTDWAPGSSGSAVLDARGNAIGHVGSISAIAAPAKGSDKPAHHMNLHWAVPAGSVLDLAKQGAPQKNGGTDTQQTGTRE